MTFFGEIVEPATRTAWEDWDECVNNDSSLKWENDLKSPNNNVETLFLFEGKYLSDIIKRSSLTLEPVNSLPNSNLTLYKVVETNNYIFIIKDYDLVKSSEITELLKDFIVESKNVISVQTKPISEYQNVTSQCEDQCIIRTVSTNMSLLDALHPKLEQPNIISGVSAGVLALRDHLNLTGIGYICYIECSEDYDIQGLKKLLNDFGIKQKDKPSNMLTTNLYI